MWFGTLNTNTSNTKRGGIRGLGIGGSNSGASFVGTKQKGKSAGIISHLWEDHPKRKEFVKSVAAPRHTINDLSATTATLRSGNSMNADRQF